MAVNYRSASDREPEVHTTQVRSTTVSAVDAGRAPEAMDGVVEIPRAYNLDHDRVRWGPIFAGFVTALTTLLLLSLFGLAFGLTVADTTAPAVRAGGVAPSGSGTGAAIWGGVSALIAFGLGGLVAGQTAAVFARRWGALNGMLVFFLAVPFTLWLAGQGLGTVLGTLGNYSAALGISAGTAQNLAGAAVNQAGQVAASVQPVDVARAAENARNAAWGTLLAMGLGIGASALGGAMGTRRRIQDGQAT